jgi:ClpX C4-type zinc finger
MDQENQKFFRAALSVLSSLAKSGDIHGVIQQGLALYLISHLDNDDTQDSLPLVYVQTAIERLMASIAETESTTFVQEFICSFCGKGPPSVELGAGPDAYICNECVQVFAAKFGVKN